jgi:hypothetical protein
MTDDLMPIDDIVKELLDENLTHGRHLDLTRHIARHVKGAKGEKSSSPIKIHFHKGDFRNGPVAACGIGLDQFMRCANDWSKVTCPGCLGFMFPASPPSSVEVVTIRKGDYDDVITLLKDAANGFKLNERDCTGLIQRISGVLASVFREI